MKASVPLAACAIILVRFLERRKTRLVLSDMVGVVLGRNEALDTPIQPKHAALFNCSPSSTLGSIPHRRPLGFSVTSVVSVVRISLADVGKMVVVCAYGRWIFCCEGHGELIQLSSARREWPLCIFQSMGFRLPPVERASGGPGRKKAMPKRCQRMSSCNTLPCTSVSRKSRPPNR